jgi:hypothetical protein
MSSVYQRKSVIDTEVELQRLIALQKSFVEKDAVFAVCSLCLRFFSWFFRLFFSSFFFHFFFFSSSFFDGLTQEYEYQEGIVGADESAQSNPDIPIESSRAGVSHNPSDPASFYQPFTFAFEVEVVPSADVVPLDKISSSMGKYATLRKQGEPVYQTLRSPAAAYDTPLTMAHAGRQPDFVEDAVMEEHTYEGFL